MIFHLAGMVKAPIIIHKVTPSSPPYSNLASLFFIMGFSIQIENEFPTFSKERVQLMCLCFFERQPTGQGFNRFASHTPTFSFPNKRFGQNSTSSPDRLIEPGQHQFFKSLTL